MKQQKARTQWMYREEDGWRVLAKITAYSKEKHMGFYVSCESGELTPAWFWYILPPHANCEQPIKIDFVEKREVVLSLTAPLTWDGDRLCTKLPNRLEPHDISLIQFHMHCDAIDFTYDTWAGPEVFHFPLAGFNKHYLIQLVKG